MSFIHLHLVINHIPVIGSVIGVVLLGYAFYSNSDESRKIALALFVALALITPLVVISGDEAHELLEKMPGISHIHELTEEHEDSAHMALVSILILGAVCAFGLFSLRKRDEMPGWVMKTVLALALLTLLLMGRTANLGGQIRHPEIRDGQAGGVVNATPASHNQPHTHADHDEDGD